jgi:hypothetical protein
MGAHEGGLAQLDLITTTAPRWTGAAIAELSQAVADRSQQEPRVQLLFMHPGVGPITALAFVLVIGEVKRFQRRKQLAIGPSEDSSAGVAVGCDQPAGQPPAAHFAGSKLPVRLYSMLKCHRPYPPAPMQGSPSHSVNAREGSSTA